MKEKIFPEEFSDFLTLSTETIALLLLEHIKTIKGVRGIFSLYTICYSFEYYKPHKSTPEFREKISESFQWLKNNMLIAEAPEHSGNQHILTSFAKQNISDINIIEKSYFKKELLHPKIQTKVWGDFLKSDYETTIFKAFKQVEVSVRKASGLSNKDIGTKLMQKAFSKDGILRDKNLQDAENIATANLFSGAIGLYKNPSSHRDVEIKQTEAMQSLMLSSLLLNILEERIKDTKNE